MNALTGMLQALQQPDLAARLGPATPGGTCPGGARVPGTSWELDPTQAAANMALLLQQADIPSRAADAVCRILAQADRCARQAILAGTPPPTMRELLADLGEACDPVDVAADFTAYAEVVSALYPPKQQPTLRGLFADPSALDAMPVQAFMAALVRNA